jgi:lipopolysaccharide/colanic/teichoic acid biosynthesis glycosyltransferase
MLRKSQQFLERVLGCGISFCILPTLLFIALLIHVTGGNPIVVTDEWPSADGAMTRCLRFRTTGHSTPFFQGVARILRIYNVDDLPGFWSVGRGDISLREFLRLLSSGAMRA